MKVVTVCGSMKFEKEMLEISRDLETKHGHCVIQCVYGSHSRQETLEELENIKNAHFKKIDLSDAKTVFENAQESKDLSVSGTGIRRNRGRGMYPFYVESNSVSYDLQQNNQERF